MPSIRRVRTVFTGVEGTPWYSNLYFDASEAGVSAEEATVATGLFWNDVSAYIQAGITATIEGETPVINDTNGEIIAYEGSPTTTVAGLSVEERLPNANQGLLVCQTDAVVRGRRLQGRIFLPGFTEDQSSNGTLIFPTREAIEGFAEDRLIDFTAANGLVVWSRPREASGSLPAAAGSSSVVTSVAVNPQFAVLRSRRD